MELNVLERAMTLGLLEEYKEGNFATYKLIGSLKNKLSLTEEETVEYNLRLEDNQFKWNEKGKEPKPIDITEGEAALVKDKLLALDREKKLTPQHLTIYVKFVGEDDKSE